MAKPTIPLPSILLAQDLRGGHVVFAAAEGWSEDPRAALVAKDASEAERLQKVGAGAAAANLVVDAALVDVDIRADGLPIPRHFRERFKISGPSVRRDLGKQARFSHRSGA